MRMLNRIDRLILLPVLTLGTKRRVRGRRGMWRGVRLASLDAVGHAAELIG